MDGQCRLSLPREGESVSDEKTRAWDVGPSQPIKVNGAAEAWAWMVNARFPSLGRVKAWLMRKQVQGEVCPSHPSMVKGRAEAWAWMVNA